MQTSKDNMAENCRAMYKISNILLSRGILLQFQKLKHVVTRYFETRLLEKSKQ